MNKILIVDDSESFLDLVKILLADEFEMDFAKSAIEALSKIKISGFDGIILDVSLPDYTGYYLGEQIRKVDPLVPIAFLTNYDGEITRENADLLGAKFWYKPNMITSNNVFIHNIKDLIDYGKERRSTDS